MHGLNTNVVLESLPTISYNYGIGQPYIAQTHDAFMGPNALGRYIQGFNEIQNARKEYFIKRFYKVDHYTNVGMQPIYMEVTRLVSRIDNDQAYYNDATNNVFGTTSTSPITLQPFGTWTISPTFRRNWKVMRQKRYILKPLQTKSVKTQVNRTWRTKSVTPNVEGDTSFVTRAGNNVTVIRFWGSIVNWTNSVGLGSNIPGLSPCMVRGMRQIYCSWTTMDDAQPDSWFSSTLGFTTIGTTGNTAGNPTYVNYNYSNPGNYEIISPDTVTVRPLP